jgi:hypothetical protein
MRRRRWAAVAARRRACFQVDVDVELVLDGLLAGVQVVFLVSPQHDAVEAEHAVQGTAEKVPNRHEHLVLKLAKEPADKAGLVVETLALLLAFVAAYLFGCSSANRVYTRALAGSPSRGATTWTNARARAKTSLIDFSSVASPALSHVAVNASGIDRCCFCRCGRCALRALCACPCEHHVAHANKTKTGLSTQPTACQCPIRKHARAVSSAEGSCCCCCGGGGCGCFAGAACVVR